MGRNRIKVDLLAGLLQGQALHSYLAERSMHGLLER
jgi:hypothetical protein